MRYRQMRRPHALFARRESDGVDWYEYSWDGKNFIADTVKFTVMWQDIHNGFVVGAATRDVSRLFPAGQRVGEIIDYHGGDDPQLELGNKLYNLDTRTLHALPLLPQGPSLEARVAAIEARLGIEQMSDVSGIPNMGFGGGNFFAPQFSYNPQMSAGQASAAYMPAENYAQNVTNNLYGGGANEGFGRQTDYYSALGASYSRASGSSNPYRRVQRHRWPGRWWRWRRITLLHHAQRFRHRGLFVPGRRRQQRHGWQHL